MNKTYRYTGPNSAVTLKVSDGAGGLKDQDVMLWHGRNVELPADHEVTRTLAHQGLLEPISEAQVSDPVAEGSSADKPAADKTAKAKQAA
jgi:phage tail protein X